MNQYTEKEVTDIVIKVMFAFMTWLEDMNQSTTWSSKTDIDMDLLTVAISSLYSGGWKKLEGDNYDFKRLIVDVCMVEKKED